MRIYNALFSRILLAILIVLVVSCSHKRKFTIYGTVKHAPGTMLYLQQRSLTSNITIDSVKLTDTGHFKFKENSIGYPEFYVLTLNDQNINLSVDSIETMEIITDKINFSQNYTIKGSENSLLLKDVVDAQVSLSSQLKDLRLQFTNSKISNDKFQLEAASAITKYKDFAKKLIWSKYNSTVAYFALFQQVDGALIFDPSNFKDLPVFQTVATMWSENKSKSPRTKQLTDLTLKAIKQKQQTEKQVNLLKNIGNMKFTSMDYLNINLPDFNNKNIDLHKFKGKVIILDFTIYANGYSAAHNVMLNMVCSQFDKNKVVIYQVAFDTDLYSWRNVATNLHWICVHDLRGIHSPLIKSYNLLNLPTVFLFNKKGELVKRIMNESELLKQIKLFI